MTRASSNHALDGSPAFVLRALVLDAVRSGRVTANTARTVLAVVDMLDGPVSNESITS